MAGVWDGSVGGGSRGSGWGGSVEEKGSTKEFESGGWEGEGVHVAAFFVVLSFST